MWAGTFDFAHSSHFDISAEAMHSNIMSTPQNATTNDSPGALVAAPTLDPHQTAHTMLATDSGIQDAFSAAAALLRVQHEPQPHHQQNHTQLDIHLKRVEGPLQQGNLSMAIQILSEITELVVSNCEYLGLSGDDNVPSAYRVKRENFWRSLNNTWIYTLTQINVSSKHSTFIDHEFLCHLRQSIVSWADVLERYGLVDYELGFWEQDLLEAIDRTLAAFLNQHSCRAFDGEVLSQCQPEMGSRVKVHDGELYSHV
ncbi:11626_t:CDS:2 [Paraglomus brasilianum]|uniref:11626_t:CDS:1 n=1 Tax=Paraglomus brasilianum TaxID=144538 RepID=A0A9N9FI96_9GLOM|nr:11626_t:CDS:2 [Paraglomus brasilianum]